MPTRLEAIPIRPFAALLPAAALLASFVAAVASPSDAVASATACRVENLDSGVTKQSLQEAVTLARGGHRLTVRGTCNGVTIIGKHLSITGIRTNASGRPTLDGDGQGSVLTIDHGVRVVIKDLHVRGGMAAKGGGVFNRGTLVLTGSTLISGNTASGSGGGVMNHHGTLRLKDNTAISGNAANNGGGVGNTHIGTVTLHGSGSIHHNIASGLIGGGVDNDGTLTLDDSSSIHHNVARQAGGVYNIGTLTLNDSSSIHHNTAGSKGGGYHDRHSFVVGDIRCPTWKVHDNSPDDCSP